MKKYTILAIEDNEPDYVLLSKALKLIADVSLDIIRAIDGQEALDFLHKRDKFLSSPTPDLIILDLNLPKTSGYEVLKAIKKDDYLKVIPTIIYSTSDDPVDIWASYALYANSYITKTFSVQELYKKISTLGEYWLKTSEIPDADSIEPLK